MANFANRSKPSTRPQSWPSAASPQDVWGAVAGGATLEVEVLEPSTKHSLTIQQVSVGWPGATTNPNEAMKQAKLKKRSCTSDTGQGRPVKFSQQIETTRELSWVHRRWPNAVATMHPITFMGEPYGYRNQYVDHRIGGCEPKEETVSVFRHIRGAASYGQSAAQCSESCHRHRRSRY